MMRQADWHARGLALRHVIDWIAVAAEPANQHPVRDVVALVKLVTLPAGVEDRANLAVVAAREQKTQPLARAIAIAKQARAAALQPRHRDRQHLRAAKLGAARPQDRQRGYDRDRSDQRADSEFFRPNLFCSIFFVQSLRIACPSIAYPSGLIAARINASRG